VDVLERIHAAGILHRDIKPSNIGFTNGGKPKLLDFGLAHILFDSRHQGALTSSDSEESSQDSGAEEESSASATLKRNVVGTPAYLSPEAIRGASPGPSFDLWSVSIILYETLTGRNPLLGDNVRDTLARVASADIPDIREERHELTQPVARFFRNVLSKNRRRRPRSARIMKAELEELRNRVLN
jgi:serine/threonine-protein kinase